MAKRQNIGSAASVALTQKLEGEGNISEIYLCPYGGHDQQVNIWLDDGGSNNYSIIANTIIPTGVALSLTDNISFDGSVYQLYIAVSSVNLNDPIALNVTIR